MFPLYTPENTIKPLVFWCFQRLYNEDIAQKWVNSFRTNVSLSLRKKCLYSEFFWSVFSHIRTEYGDLLDQYGPFLCSVYLKETVVQNGSYAYLETLSQTCSFKDCSEKFHKIH